MLTNSSSEYLLSFRRRKDPPSTPILTMKNLIALGLASLLIASPALAIPIRYEFSQDGYEEGATVSGWFFADDLDGDGQIAQLGGVGSELVAFMMSFSGNSIVPAFNGGFSELFGLVWDLDATLGNGRIGATEGIRLDKVDGTQYLVPEGPLTFPPGGRIIGPNGATTETLNLVTVLTTDPGLPTTPGGGQGVPSGGTTILMLGMGLLGLAAAKRKLA